MKQKIKKYLQIDFAIILIKERKKLADIIPKDKYMYKHFMDKTPNSNSVYF